MSLAAYLTSGAGSILAGKWEALTTNFATLAVAPGGLAAFPFALVGLWRLRHTPVVQLTLFYGGVLFAAVRLGLAGTHEAQRMQHDLAATMDEVLDACRQRLCEVEWSDRDERHRRQSCEGSSEQTVGKERVSR